MAGEDLTGMSVVEALALLAERGDTGSLYVATTYRRVTMQIVEGEVALIQSDRPSDRIGLQLMKAGDIGVIDLHGALIEQHQQRLMSIANDTETARLGEILLARNVLDPDELADALERYSRAVVTSLDQDFVLNIEFVEGEDVERDVPSAVDNQAPRLKRVRAQYRTPSPTPSE